MRILTRAVIGVLLVAGAAACSKDKPSAPGQGFVYPLKVGNRWEYDSKREIHNVRGLRDNVPLPHVYTYRENTVVEVMETERRSDGQTVYRLRERYEYEDHNFLQGFRSFANYDDGLHYVTGELFGFASPTRSTEQLEQGEDWNPRMRAGILGGWGRARAVEASKSAARPATDGPDGTDWISLKYPLAIGDKWTYAEWIDGDGIPQRVTKEIQGTESIHAAGKNHACHVVSESWSGWPADQDYDYIADIGLVARTQLFRDVPILNSTTGDTMGLYDENRYFTLKSYTLK